MVSNGLVNYICVFVLLNQRVFVCKVPKSLESAEVQEAGDVPQPICIYIYIDTYIYIYIPRPAKVPKITAQYPKIDSLGCIGSIV